MANFFQLEWFVTVRQALLWGAVVLGCCLGPGAHGKLSPLAPNPDWKSLEAYQETITREDFETLLNKVYAPHGAAKKFIEIGDSYATIQTGRGQPPFVLRFAPSRGEAKAIPAYWRPRAQLPAPPADKPLAGLKIAIDPGHIGGDWAKTEERWFQVGTTKPVTEGDMTLLVARLLVPQLKSLGAQVYLTRSKPKPTTSLRPEKLTKQAASSLARKGRKPTPTALRKESELLFYRVGEIRRRAELVNEVIRPDLVLCLHFNAESWGNEKRPRLVDDNHLHFLVTGVWSEEELSYEDQRLDMLVKLLTRSFPEEVAVSRAVADSMAKATGLPPYTYRSPNAINVGNNPYLWARNLLANRLFTCPVVYVEPYVMNSRAAFARIQAGDYQGTRIFGGVRRKSIYREYADSLVEGLVNYYSRR